FIRNELQEIVALVNQRNQELKQGLDTSKLTAQLRRRFSSIDRDLKLLRSSLTKLADQISDHEITRRRSEVDNLIDQKNDIYKTFSRPPRVKKYFLCHCCILIDVTTVIYLQKEHIKQKILLNMMIQKEWITVNY